MSPRGRHRNVDGVASIIAKHSPRHNFFVYGDNLKKTKVQAHLIVPQSALIRDLARVAPTLSLVQSDLEKSLLQVYAAKAGSPGWTMDEEGRKQWAKVTGQRMRCMLRHVSQARVKCSGAAWLKMLDLPAIYSPPGPSAAARTPVVPDVISSDGDEEEEKAKDAETEPSQLAGAAETPVGEERDDEGDDLSCQAFASGVGDKFYFGLDRLSKHAWRSPVGSPKERELADRIIAPAGARPSDLAMAVWPDGVQWRVAGLTVEEVQAGSAAQAPVRKRAAPKRKGAAIVHAPLFEGVLKSGEKVKVAREGHVLAKRNKRNTHTRRA